MMEHKGHFIFFSLYILFLVFWKKLLVHFNKIPENLRNTLMISVKCFRMAFQLNLTSAWMWKLTNEAGLLKSSASSQVPVGVSVPNDDQNEPGTIKRSGLLWKHCFILLFWKNHGMKPTDFRELLHPLDIFINCSLCVNTNSLNISIQNLQAHILLSSVELHLEVST